MLKLFFIVGGIALYLFYAMVFEFAWWIVPVIVIGIILIEFILYMIKESREMDEYAKEVEARIARKRAERERAEQENKENS